MTPHVPVSELLEALVRAGAGRLDGPTAAALAPRLVERALEALEAADRGEDGRLREALGGVLLVMGLIGETAPAQLGLAAIIREACAAARGMQTTGDAGPGPGRLGGVPRTLPALTRAVCLQDRAAETGFDWASVPRVLDKISEELEELQQELGDADPSRLEHELGDVLMAVTNLARHLGVEPERALRRANRRFERRFGQMEAFAAAAGRRLADLPLKEQERLWQLAKVRLSGTE